MVFVWSLSVLLNMESMLLVAEAELFTSVTSSFSFSLKLAKFSSILFLAAMSSSRSDGVTQLVRTHVTLLFKRSYEANESYLSLPINLQMTKDP